MIIPNRDSRIGSDFGLSAPYDVMTMVELYERGRGVVQSLVGECNSNMKLPFDRDKKIYEESFELRTKIRTRFPDPHEVVEIIMKAQTLTRTLVEEKKMLTANLAIAGGLPMQAT